MAQIPKNKLENSVLKLSLLSTNARNYFLISVPENYNLFFHSVLVYGGI